MTFKQTIKCEILNVLIFYRRDECRADQQYHTRASKSRIINIKIEKLNEL